MDDRCYFGCEGPIGHTLLELPPPHSTTPDLCIEHGKSWRAYKTRLNHAFSWPEDFWPWVDSERKTMEEAKNARTVEDRKPGTGISAEEAIVGAWYTVPSGETERCVAKRARGRGTQAGFVSIFDPGADSEDIRWLPGRTKILVEDEIEAAKLLGSLAADQKLPAVASDLAFKDCPRNGLLCSECECPQRTTPHGDTCENGHGGVSGIHPLEVMNVLGADGHTEEAKAILAALPPLLRPSPTEEARILERAANVREVLESKGSSPAMPNWSDDEGRCHFEVVGVPCYRSGKKCPMHSEEPQAGDPTMTVEEITKEYPEAVQSAKQALEADTMMSEWIAEQSKPEGRKPLAGPTTVFHKSLHIDHRTPKELFEAEVRRWGSFYLDCAATEENKLCEYALTPEIDALSVDWVGTEEIYAKHGRNRWLNHPYSRGEDPCPDDPTLCTKKKCPERGYHINQRIASSGEWLKYARDQVLKDGIPTDVLTKAAVETNWWRDAVRVQPSEAGKYLGGEVDPFGGPALEFLDGTPYKAATWFRFTWEHLVIEVTEIEGRVEFEREGNDGGAGFASALVMFYRPGHKFHE